MAAFRAASCACFRKFIAPARAARWSVSFGECHEDLPCTSGAQARQKQPGCPRTWTFPPLSNNPYRYFVVAVAHRRSHVSSTRLPPLPPASSPRVVAADEAFAEACPRRYATTSMSPSNCSESSPGAVPSGDDCALCGGGGGGAARCSTRASSRPLWTHSFEKQRNGKSTSCHMCDPREYG